MKLRRNELIVFAWEGYSTPSNFRGRTGSPSYRDCSSASFPDHNPNTGIILAREAFFGINLIITIRSNKAVCATAIRLDQTHANF